MPAEGTPPRLPPTTPELHLDGFDGPLDLLLDLAERERIDLARLSIGDLVDQFVAAMARFEGRVSARALTTRWQTAEALGLILAGFALQSSAQSLNCPMPQTAHGPGVLKETPVQIAETGSFLASGDSINRAPEVVADLRKRYPGVGDAEIENYLVTAYCPVAAKLNGLSVAERQARVDRFARQANAAVYGH
jgi:hypothetical protein